jgi:hypothetical protein
VRAPALRRILCGVAFRVGYRTLTLSAACALAGLAQAQPTPPVALSRSSTDFLAWEAPHGCGTAEVVSNRVKELLGESAGDLSRARRVEARVSRTRAGWVLDLRVFGGSGKRERRLEAEACGDLAEAAAVAISLAIDAERAAGGAAASPPDSAAAGANPESDGAGQDTPSGGLPSDGAASIRSSTVVTGPTASAPPGDADSPSPSAGSGQARLSIGAEFVSDITSLSAFAPGASLVVRLRQSEWALAAYGLGLAATERVLGPDQSVRFSLVGGGLRASYRLGEGLVETALCAGLEVGRLSARGVGLLGAQTVHDLWLTPHAGLELSSALSGVVAAYVRGDAVVPLLRQEYAVNEVDRVHRISAVGARGAVGILVMF